MEELSKDKSIEDTDVKSKNEFKAVLRLEKFSDKDLLVFLLKVSQIA